MSLLPTTPSHGAAAASPCRWSQLRGAATGRHTAASIEASASLPIFSSPDPTRAAAARKAEPRARPGPAPRGPVAAMAAAQARLPFRTTPPEMREDVRIGAQGRAEVPGVHLRQEPRAIPHRQRRKLDELRASSWCRPPAPRGSPHSRRRRSHSTATSRWGAAQPSGPGRGGKGRPECSDKGEAAPEAPRTLGGAGRVRPFPGEGPAGAPPELRAAGLGGGAFLRLSRRGWVWGCWPLAAQVAAPRGGRALAGSPWPPTARGLPRGRGPRVGCCLSPGGAGESPQV